MSETLVKSDFSIIRFGDTYEKTYSGRVKAEADRLIRDKHINYEWGIPIFSIPSIKTEVSSIPILD